MLLSRPIRQLVSLVVLLGTIAGIGLLQPAAGAAPGDPDPDALTLSLEPVVDGFDSPVFVTGAGDGSGRLFVVERSGSIKVVEDGTTTVFLDLRSVVGTDGDKRGLLGLAFHPDFATTHELFVSYTALDGANTIARYRTFASTLTVDPASAEIVLTLPDRVPDHNLGMLAFGPDGYLYTSTGDEGGTGDPYKNAQNLESYYGKILRLDVDVATGSSAPYEIPADNPFVEIDGALGEIWAYGLRSPWRFSFDRTTGDLWLADVGQNEFEEVNYQPAGESGQNYGWPTMEGASCYPKTRQCDQTGLTLPIDDYDHSFGCSVTGGYVYRGQESPVLAGQYLFGDFCSGRIWSLRQEGGEWLRTELLDSTHFPSSFGEGDDGELYLTDIVDGTVYQIVAEPVYPAPALTGLYPFYVLAGSDAITLRVYGSGFTRDSVIVWDGTALPTTYVSSAQVSAEVATSELAAVREVPVSVTNPEPGGGEAESFAFYVSDTNLNEGSFQRTWARTDDPVTTGAARRTWMWGDRALSAPLEEDYLESPGGFRTVQYYDKARMEITNPGNDMDSLWYVTNGLLVRELMTGDMQRGHYYFETRTPATVNIAGDPDDPDGPTYATFAPLMGRAPLDSGDVITQTLDRAGTIGDDPALADLNVTAAERVQVEGINHTVASVFWEFMNSRGMVLEDGTYAEDNLFENPFYATGFPLTEAYWSRVRVGGTVKLVLVQAFERRVLTYTPDNPDGWKVEAGNVGQHYYRWRHGELPVE